MIEAVSDAGRPAGRDQAIDAGGGGEEAGIVVASADAARRLRASTRQVRAALGSSASAPGGGAPTGTFRDFPEGKDVDAAFARFASLRASCDTLCRALTEQFVACGAGWHNPSASAAAAAVPSWPGFPPGKRSSRPPSDVSIAGGRYDCPFSDARDSRTEPKAGRLHRRATAPATSVVELFFGEDPDSGHSVIDGPRETAAGSELEAVREWKACLEELATAHKVSLTQIYKRFEQFATPDILETIFNYRKSCVQTINKSVKNFRAYKRIRGHGTVWPKWETQFRNYEEVSTELAKITEILQSAESGISPGRTVRECIIAPRGDTILEFANTATPQDPVWRFRVSSYMLAETSPIFSRMFSKHHGHSTNGDTYLAEDDELSQGLPPAPTPFNTEDGSRVLLYRMPQLELNRESALTILFHAAHMHNDRVPRKIPFEQFVAIAEVCLRYRCTSPLEVVVEHRWLPQWMHKATEDMPEGLILISYAFGSRRLFARVTKTAILNLEEEDELTAKNWPPRMKERIWAIRCAKIEQVHATCVRAIEEFLNPPAHSHEALGCRDTAAGDGDSKDVAATDVAGNQRRPGSPATPATSSLNFSASLFAALPSTTTNRTPFAFDSKPRCPKGSHWCDATNLGWLMLVFNQLQLLSSILSDAVLSRPNLSFRQAQAQAQAQSPSRSLAQIVESLRGITGPPNPVHPPELRSGVCDPAPALRAAINDVYNSVEGLTLFDVDGRRHGWAFSRRLSHVREPSSRYEAVSGGDPTGMYRDDYPFSRTKVRGSISSQEDPGSGREDGDGSDDDYGSDGTSDNTSSDNSNDDNDEDGGKGNRDMASSASSIPEPPRSPAERALSHEKVCLKLLSALDNFGDLNALAAANHETYRAYKAHELHLMKGVILWGSATTDPPSRRRSAIAPSYARKPIISGGALSPPAPAPLDPILTMTEEEARRILWPEDDQNDPTQPSESSTMGLDGPLVSSPISVVGDADSTIDDHLGGVECGLKAIVRIENKTLVVEGKKQLREDMDRRLGLTVG